MQSFTERVDFVRRGANLVVLGKGDGGGMRVGGSQGFKVSTSGVGGA